MDLYGPLAQAERCLSVWLKAENLCLPKEAQTRTAVLMARYFMHEDQVTDQLMMSFLRRYSRKTGEDEANADIEDPTLVRREIKTLLDHAEEKKNLFSLKTAGLVAVIICAALLFSAWSYGQRPITPAQQAELKSLVHKITEADPALSSAAVWKRVKEPLHVRSYQDIRAWDYNDSRTRLEDLLHEAQANSSMRPGVGAVVNGQ